MGSLFPHSHKPMKRHRQEETEEYGREEGSVGKKACMVEDVLEELMCSELGEYTSSSSCSSSSCSSSSSSSSSSTQEELVLEMMKTLEKAISASEEEFADCPNGPHVNDVNEYVVENDDASSCHDHLFNQLLQDVSWLDDANYLELCDLSWATPPAQIKPEDPSSTTTWVSDQSLDLVSQRDYSNSGFV